MNPGYPHPPPGYPQPQSGYPQPQSGYPQPQSGYPQPQSGYPQPQSGYPHAQQQSGYPALIVQQPVPQGPPGGWMNIPQAPTNCPRGLEYLTMIDTLLIHQKVELLEAFVGFETNNKYTIKNSVGQKVYFAVEDNDCCTRMCCGSLRPFDMKILDNFQNEIIHIRRPLACDSCCFPCCLQKMEVCAPPGTVIGTVEQHWTICKPHYSIKDANKQVVLQIRGPMCKFSCGNDVRFNVFSRDGGTKVGQIVKQWSGLTREIFTDADYFGVSFPMDLDVRIKAVMLGACFLIDFMFFERSQKNTVSCMG